MPENSNRELTYAKFLETPAGAKVIAAVLKYIPVDDERARTYAEWASRTTRSMRARALMEADQRLPETTAHLSPGVGIGAALGSGMLGGATLRQTGELLSTFNEGGMDEVVEGMSTADIVLGIVGQTAWAAAVFAGARVVTGMRDTSRLKAGQQAVEAADEARKDAAKLIYNYAEELPDDRRVRLAEDILTAKMGSEQFPVAVIRYLGEEVRLCGVDDVTRELAHAREGFDRAASELEHDAVVREL